MTKREASNYILESADIHQEIIKKLLKWVVQKKKLPGFSVSLCVHNYHSWDSSSFVGFKEHCARMPGCSESQRYDISDNAYKYAHILTVGENIYRSRVAINQSLTGTNRTGTSSCVD